MKYDILTFGRSSIDVYTKDIGAEFVDINEFTASIGGSPVNIAVGAQRLGLKTAVLTAVGPDPVGDFIIHTLNKEGVSTDYIPTIEGTTSTAVICGIIPPDKFPLVFYRDNAPDKKINNDHVDQIDFKDVKSFLMTGTSLAVEPSRSASFYAAQQAKKQNLPVFLDIDFRAISWDDVRSFGITLKEFLPYCDVVMGTEEELLAMNVESSSEIKIKNSSITSPEIQGDLQKSIQQVLDLGVKLLLVKTGPKGVDAYFSDGTKETIPGFPVQVVNVLGAGDAFAAGFVYGYTKGWDTYKSARLANACGAWLVTKQGCCTDAPNNKQIMDFIKDKGGF